MAVHHPVLASWALLPCILGATAAFARPAAWPVWLLPLLPLVGGMPWTGWLLVEEWDLLVLAVAAGGFARWAWTARERPSVRWTLGAAVGWLLLAMYSASLGISTWRGIVDAGGLRWGWWQGYQEPMNALRLAKALPLTLLLLPLLVEAQPSWAESAARRLRIGGAGMLATAALPVLWERLAYTGLTDFSVDYRVTGLFWEMHVGGAALDAYLVAAVPLAAAAWLAAHGAMPWLLASATLLVGVYACLSTFSRIVYVAVPLTLACLALLRWRSSQTTSTAEAEPQAAWPPWVASTAALVAFAAAAMLMFPTSGYRGMLALLAAFALTLPLLGHAPMGDGRGWRLGVTGGAALAVIAGLATAYVPKGAYIGCAAMAVAGLACAAAYEMALSGAAPTTRARSWLMACTIGLCAAIPAVAVHWGGQEAAPSAGATGVLLAVAVVLATRAPRPLWPPHWQRHATLVAAMATTGLLVGVFGGGAYMGGRWAAVEHDLGMRVDHARGALALWHDNVDMIFGRGLGRYAATQALTGSRSDVTGDFRWLDDAEGPRLLLTSGNHILGWGQLFRVLQRIPAPTGAASVHMRVRTQQETVLHAEVCDRQLLYTGTCLAGQHRVKPSGGAWQDVRWRLDGTPPSRGDFWAPRLITFAIALGVPGSKVEFDRVELFDGDGRQMLANGSFSRGMAHWFFTSDRHHLPWHAKNLWAHLLFEHGVLGCVLFAALTLLALWRLTLGGLRHHAFAPTLAVSLIGLHVVGLVDSLLDAPRVAFLMYALTGIGALTRHRSAEPLASERCRD